MRTLDHRVLLMENEVFVHILSYSEVIWSQRCPLSTVFGKAGEDIATDRNRSRDRRRRWRDVAMGQGKLGLPGVQYLGEEHGFLLGASRRNHSCPQPWLWTSSLVNSMRWVMWFVIFCFHSPMTVRESSRAVDRTLTKLGKTGSRLRKEMPGGGGLEKKPKNPFP